MRRTDGHAVVLGAGIAGLLAAAALQDTFEKITIVERDRLDQDGPRRGVPHGRHAHALMPRGSQLLDELLPGISDELLAAGAVRSVPLRDFRMRVNGRALRQVPIGVVAVQAGRPFLEAHLRRRVRGEILDERDVVGLVADGPRVTGVRITPRAAGSAEETLDAELVVDAMGRGGRTPAWLEALGYARPSEDQPRVDVGYASRLVRLTTEGAGLEPIIGIGPVPGHARGMVMVAVEGGLRMLTVTGYGHANRPPSDEAGFAEFVATVAPPDVLAAIRVAEPVGAIATYRYPSYLRRHYERLRSFPEGLLVVGDAMCSFSPVYAQGMTVAALEAVALRECVAAGLPGVAQRFFRAAAAIVEEPWQTAVTSDLVLPEVPGRRTLGVRLRIAFTDRVLAATEHDDEVATAFAKVVGLLEPGTTLMRPAILRRIFRRPAAAVAAPREVAR